MASPPAAASASSSVSPQPPAQPPPSHFAAPASPPPPSRRRLSVPDVWAAAAAAARGRRPSVPAAIATSTAAAAAATTTSTAGGLFGRLRLAPAPEGEAAASPWSASSLSNPTSPKQLVPPESHSSDDATARLRAQSLTQKTRNSLLAVRALSDEKLRRNSHLSVSTTTSSSATSLSPASYSAGSRAHSPRSVDGIVVDEHIRRRDHASVVETTTVSRKIADEQTVNQYTIIAEIGKGSYGSVFRAVNNDDGKTYAIKVISKRRLRKRRMSGRSAVPSANASPSDELAEIRHEVAILKKISAHPYFVRLVEVINNDEEDCVYMVFDICEKGTIMKVSMTKTAEPFPELVAWRYFRQIVLGLEFLHHQRIIHGDIKPENLLVNAEDNVQFADFGVSHIFEGDDDWLRSSAGSPAFNAPEICSSSTKNFRGKAVDVWAAGVTLYCFIFGRVPFSANSVVALYAKIIHEQVTFPHEINPDLKDLLERMLEKDVDKRITLKEIRDHPWVTANDANPLPSEEQNCEFVEVTQEDVSAAVSSTVTGRFAAFKQFKDKLLSSRRLISHGRHASTS